MQESQYQPDTPTRKLGPDSGVSTGTADALPEQFGKYRLIKKLGQGGMGTVYLAHDPMLKRQVALKSLILEDVESTARFMREAQSTAKLKHPHIVNVYEAGVVGKTYYLTMDYIDGVTLADLIHARDASLTPKRIAEIIRDIASALAYAHSNDIIHRDIKPGNILIDRSGHPYLTDFGLAKELSGLDRSLTMSGTAIGTPDYMAPEQAMGKRDEIDKRSDIFSLGATLYHALTGRLPFVGTELFDVLNKVVNHEPPTPSSIIVVHKDMETICLKCLDKEKSRRYQTMEELADDLKRYLDGEPIKASRISAVTKLWRKIKKNKTISLSVAGAAVILLAAVAWLVISSARTADRLKGYRAEADKLFAEQKYDEALIACEKIREITLSDGKINDLRQKCLQEVGQQKTQTKLRAQAGAILDQAQRINNAEREIEIARAALKIDPTFARAYQLMGTAYAKKFDFPKAVENLNRALEIAPESAAAYYERAMIMRNWSQPEKALADFKLVLKYDPDGYMGWFAKGNLESTQGKYADAIKSFTRAISKYPDYSDAYIKRGFMYLVENENSKAINDLSKAIRLGRVGEDVYITRAHAYEKTDQWGLVIDDYSFILNNLNSKNTSVLYKRGLAYRHNNEIDKAIADWTEAIRLNPKDATSYYERGTAYSEKGDLDRAIADLTVTTAFGYRNVYFSIARMYFDKISPALSPADRQKLLDKTIANYTEAIRYNPKTVESYHNRGLAYHDNGELNRAIADYNEALKLNPKDALIYYCRARSYKDKKEPAKAIADYTESIRLNPKLSSAYNERGLCYFDIKEIDNAMADYNEALRLVPDFADAYNNRGAAYYDKKEFDRAIADLTKTLQLDPQCMKAHYNRGLAYYDKGEFDKALADYTEAIRLNPLYVQSYHNRGLVYYDKKELDKALADLNEALRLNRGFAQAYSTRGSIYQEKGDVERAIADYKEAIRLDPKYIDAYFNRGSVFLGREEWDKAIADYSAAIQLKPGYAKAYYYRGVTYFRKGSFDKAVADFTETLNADPGFNDAYADRALAYARAGRFKRAIADGETFIKLMPNSPKAGQLREWMKEWQAAIGTK